MILFSRFSLVATNNSMAQDIKYGDKECAVRNKSYFIDSANFTITKEFCEKNESIWCKSNNDTNACYWKYLGTGLSYQLLAGPLYIVLFSFSGIPLGNERSVILPFIFFFIIINETKKKTNKTNKDKLSNLS